MRIALVGSHGTGKTTLLKAIEASGKFDGYRKITEVSRSLIEELGFNPLVGESTYEKKHDFEWKIFKKQVEEENKSPKFVSDRSIFDILAYASTLLDTIDFAHFHTTVHQLRYERYPYDLLVFVPIEFPMEKDGIRPEDEEYRHEIERRMQKLLNLA